MFSGIMFMVFAAYLVQCLFSYMQMVKTQKMINQIKHRHIGEDLFMVSGSGKRKFFIINRGVFIVMLVDSSNVIVEYHTMQGYTIFASLKEDCRFKGITLDEAERLLKKKNQRKAFLAAREQIQMLYEQSVSQSEMCVS